MREKVDEFASDFGICVISPRTVPGSPNFVPDLNVVVTCIPD
jgi:hypothetical protein